MIRWVGLMLCLWLSASARAETGACREIRTWVEAGATGAEAVKGIEAPGVTLQDCTCGTEELADDLRDSVRASCVAAAHAKPPPACWALLGAAEGSTGWTVDEVLRRKPVYPEDVTCLVERGASATLVLRANRLAGYMQTAGFRLGDPGGQSMVYALRNGGSGAIAGGITLIVLAAPAGVFGTALLAQGAAWGEPGAVIAGVGLLAATAGLVVGGSFLIRAGVRQNRRGRITLDHLALGPSSVRVAGRF